MTALRVSTFTAPPVVEEKPNPRTTIDPHRSALPASSPQPQAPAAEVSLHRTAQANFLARNARAGGARQAAASTAVTGAGRAWDAGLVLGCELVQAVIALQPDALDDMIRPLASGAQTPAPAAADFLADAVTRLQTSGLREQIEGLSRQLEELKSKQADIDALGFYAVMATMAAAGKIADAIRNDSVNDACTKVTRQVQDFAVHVESLLPGASAAAYPKTRQLITMAKAAMKIPFEYFFGKGMPPSLSRLMLNWSKTASRATLREAQKKLEDALGCFIDSRTGKRDQAD